jgi:large subunit ribosomal protein L21
MYAVIETGGKQYRVSPGQTIEVDTIAGDVGSAVEFDRVLALSNESNELVLGDVLKSARVRAKIASHGRGRNNTSAPWDIARITRACR